MSAVFDATAAGAAPSAATTPARRSPLLAGAPVRPIAFDADGAVALADFERAVRAVAATLPEGAYAVNLCEDRFRFLVAFCAAALRGQATLLPPSRAPRVVDEVLARHPHSYCLGDAVLEPCPPHYHRLPAQLPRLDGEPLQLDDDALVAIGFTSGSTGQPRPNPKTWGSFRASSAQNLAALADLLDAGGCTPLVATVPPQHMYGMEMSVLLPLLGPVAVHGARPFFPEEVARALAEAPRRPLLVSTPVHLRALVQSGVALPPLAGIVSATAPLPAELAAAAEARFGCEVRELFGSTETCVIARRRSAVDTAWTPLPGVRLAPQPDGTAVQAPHLAAPVVLADLVELQVDGRFELRGRNADLLEIAGKRASLGDLTRKLLAVPGVVDGVVFQLDETDDMGVRRIAALAVAPGVPATTITASLRASLDPIFLPRPLRVVPALPRNETGKLPRQALLALLHGSNAGADARLNTRSEPPRSLTLPSRGAGETASAPPWRGAPPPRMARNTVMDLMSIIIWLIVGGIIGWIASLIMKTDAQQGIFLNIVVGIVGAFLGGWLFGLFFGGGADINDGISLTSILVSLVGAIILLAIVNLFRRGRVR